MININKVIKDSFKKMSVELGIDDQPIEQLVQNTYDKLSYSFSTDYVIKDVFSEDLVVEYITNSLYNHKVLVYNEGIFMLNQLYQNIHEDFDTNEFVDNLWYHDLSKYGARECIPYALHDFGSKDYDERFEIAWNHHKKRNEHHPEYWLSTYRDGESFVLEMPKIYVFEMVADWLGASKSYGNPIESWIPSNISSFRLHNRSAHYLLFLLDKLGIVNKNSYIVKDNQIVRKT